MNAPDPVTAETAPDLARTARRLRPVLFGVTAIGLAIGCWYAHWNLVNHRFQTITPGKVYQSGAFDPADLAQVVTEHGIRTVIDFRRGDDEQGTVEAEARALAAIGVAHVHLPTGQVPAQETVDGFLQIMDDPNRYPVLIHCFHGEGRSSLFVALYRIEYEEWTNEQARQATRLVPALSSFSLDERKGAFLRDYVRRAPVLPARQ